MYVTLWTLPDCERCVRAKDVLHKYGQAFSQRSAAPIFSGTADMDDPVIAAADAALRENDDELPIIQIDDEFFPYLAGLSAVKKRKDAEGAG